MQYLDQKRVEIVYEMPLAEVLFDFYDRLKSISRGYASFDYDVIGFKPTDLVKIDILINGKPVDALSQLCFRANAYDKARHVCEQLREEITRQQFKIAIQGAIGSQIIARETVNALRKDVLAKFTVATLPVNVNFGKSKKRERSGLRWLATSSFRSRRSLRSLRRKRTDAPSDRQLL
jgi:translation elongation factor EF-4